MPTTKEYISEMILPGSTDVKYIKDAELTAKVDLLVSGSSYIGETTTNLTDESLITTLIITSPSKYAGTWTADTSWDFSNKKFSDGCLVTKNSSEFLFDGEKWHLLGESTGLGLMAFCDTASGSASASIPNGATFSGTLKALSLSGTPSTSVDAHSYTPTGNIDVDVTDDSESANYTPEGTISGITWTGLNTSVTATYKPKGNLSGITWTGSSSTFSGNYTPTGATKADIGDLDVSGSTTYTPEGDITLPAFHGSSSSTTVNDYMTGGTISNVVTGVSSTSSTTPAIAAGNVTYKVLLASYNSTNERLTFSYADYSTPAAINATATVSPIISVTPTIAAPTFTPTKGNKTIAIIPQGTVDAPAFNGKQATIDIDSTNTNEIELTFAGSTSLIFVQGTPSGSITNQGTFTGTQETITSSGTAKGSITNQGTFTGKNVEISATFNGQSTSLTHTMHNPSMTVSGNYTPQGNVTLQPATQLINVTVHPD